MSKLEKIIVAVTNDLTHDQRVRKVCASLQKLGFEPHLVGRKLNSSVEIERTYPTTRFRLIFNKGALFYAEYNLRLFLFLLFKKYKSIHANDLDTLLASFLASKVRSKKLVYDTHEYFTEVPELQNNPFAKRTWERIENWIFSKLKDVITVNESIANLYTEKYHVPVSVMRNIPESRPVTMIHKDRNMLGLPEDKTILMVQGTGINVDRGNEEMVEAMQFLDGFFLLIIGSGDVLPALKKQVSKLGIEDRVMFKDKMPYGELYHYTKQADAGLSLDKDTNINYKFSLPNKIFDFIHAHVPCIVSDLLEVKRVVSEYKVGTVLTSHEPEKMAKEIKEFFGGESPKNKLSENLSKAASELTWENEEKVLERIYSK